MRLLIFFCVCQPWSENVWNMCKLQEFSKICSVVITSIWKIVKRRELLMGREVETK